MLQAHAHVALREWHLYPRRDEFAPDRAVDIGAQYAGARFWIAGLADALPDESVQLFRLAREGKHVEALRLLHWFLPLLRFDTGIKFVQLIKLVQERCGVCSARVRAPRLELIGAELADAEAVIAKSLATRSHIMPSAARG